MQSIHKYYLVDGTILPNVFSKVVYANKLLKTGLSKTATEASKKAGISRSVFYKYKDFIRPYYQQDENSIITIYALLNDLPGVLSSFLSVLASQGANVLTINQNIPVNSQAPITISAQTNGLINDIDTLLLELSKTNGVLNVDIISGN